MHNGTATLKGNRNHQITTHGRNILIDKLHMLEQRWGDILEIIKSQTTDSYEFTKNSHELQDISLEMQRINYVLQTATELVPYETNVVELGSRVTVECEGKTKEYQVVHSIEADPDNGYISDQCPLGAGLLGKSENNIVHIQGPRLSHDYKIVKIEKG